MSKKVAREPALTFEQLDDIICDPAIITPEQMDKVTESLKTHGKEDPDTAHVIEDKLYKKFIRHIADRDYEEYDLFLEEREREEKERAATAAKAEAGVKLTEKLEGQKVPDVQVVVPEGSAKTVEVVPEKKKKAPAAPVADVENKEAGVKPPPAATQARSGRVLAAPASAKARAAVAAKTTPPVPPVSKAKPAPAPAPTKPTPTPSRAPSKSGKQMQVEVAEKLSRLQQLPFVRSYGN
jgi:hypothetical protein